MLSLAACVWLAYETWRLLLQQGFWGAVDLRIYHTLIRQWLAGWPVYTSERTAVHPPATYVMLWPLLGWLAFTPVRWFWALTTVATLAWLIHFIVRASGASTPLERRVIALLPLAMYATGAAIGNGQLITHLLPALLVALTLLSDKHVGWRGELGGALLFLFTLVKPTISAPFFWIVLFAAGRVRTAVFIALAYAGLTMFSVSFQDETLVALVRQWLSNPGMAAQRGQSNVYSWLTNLKLQHYAGAMSLLVLGGHGVWTFRHRRASLWTLMAVAALVARMWTYHAWYDDLLLLVPMLALFRIAKTTSDSREGTAAGFLFGAGVLTTLAPGGLYLFPPPWNTLYTTGQAAVWITMLWFLLVRAWRETSGEENGRGERI